MSGKGEHAGRGSWNHTGPFSVPYVPVGFLLGCYLSIPAGM